MARKKNTDPENKVAQGAIIRVSERVERVLRILALEFGLEYNTRGNMWGLVNGIGKGVFGATFLGESPETMDLLEGIGKYLHGHHPFRLRYTNEESEEVDILISGGSLGLDLTRGYYYLGFSPTIVNAKEIKPLQNNHCIYLRQITALLGATNEVRWSSEIPSIPIRFWVGVESEYRPLERDKFELTRQVEESLLPKHLRDKDGIIVSRNIACTRLFDLALRHYSQYYILSDSVRDFVSIDTRYNPEEIA